METQEKSDNNKNLKEEDILERLSDMRKTLLTLEWDKKHNQIHFGMEEKYNKLKEEYEALEKQLNALRALEKEEEKGVEESKEEAEEKIIEEQTIGKEEKGDLEIEEKVEEKEGNQKRVNE